MSSLVLYRKYRPATFADLVGQEHVKKTITNALKEGIVSHGYLFSGPHGCGKTTMARLLAKALNCQNRKTGQYEPCNQCNSCLEINQGKALDLIEIDAASNRGIDEVRDLKEGIKFLPANSKYKIFILDEAHQLSKDAANALLKTLEEPPSHAIFILATTELRKMIPTIVSRCQSFSFYKIQLEEIIERLEKILKAEKITYDKEALGIIALSAGGALRDAESMLAQAISFVGQDGKIEKKEVEDLLGLADKEAILNFLTFLQKKQAKEAMDLLNNVILQSADLKEFTKSLIAFLRQMLLLKIDDKLESPLLATLAKEEKKTLLNLGQSFQENELKTILEIMMTAENKMKYASIQQLPLELAIIDICLKNQ